MFRQQTKMQIHVYVYSLWLFFFTRFTWSYTEHCTCKTQYVGTSIWHYFQTGLFPNNIKSYAMNNLVKTGYNSISFISYEINVRKFLKMGFQNPLKNTPPPPPKNTTPVRLNGTRQLFTPRRKFKTVWFRVFHIIKIKCKNKTVKNECYGCNSRVFCSINIILCVTLKLIFELMTFQYTRFKDIKDLLKNNLTF